MSGRAFPDCSYHWWDLRLSIEHGTIEVRAADTQTRVDDAAAIVAFVLSLVYELAGRVDDGEIGNRPVRAERLGAGEDVAAFADFSVGTHIERVRAAFRFGHSVDSDQATVAQPRQILFLLRFRAVLPDWHHAGEQMGADGED